MFLTPEELKQLTGYARPSNQARRLKKLGLRHWINARGRVVVPRSAVEGKPSERKTFEPDFSGLGT